MLEKINLRVFLPPVILLILVLIYSIIDATGMVQFFELMRVAILSKFDWLFNLVIFSFVLLLIVLYFSPLGKIKIGGEQAQPLLQKWQWFSVVLCTTVATGILFWGAAEPLYHLSSPPSTDIIGGTETAAVTAMSSLYMHWTISPYAMYTSFALLFAIVYYNFRRPFRVSSLIISNKKTRENSIVNDFIDAFCLLALVAGMSASLGAGVLTLSGGLEQQFGLDQNPVLWSVIILLIVTAFILSAASGLQKGIKWLSQINVITFIILIVIFGISLIDITALKFSMKGAAEFITNFVPRSLGLSNFERSWEQNWMSFYWANWMAWAPVTALFLGRLGVGYTVREFIRINLVYTSLFSFLWMTIFGGIALSFDLNNGGVLHEILLKGGPQDVLFTLIEQLPATNLMAFLFLVVVYISFVTAADSNTSAMSGLSSYNIDPEHPEASLIVKVIWGGFIAMLAWIMISFAGIDGIKIMSVLGGFPILFFSIIIIAAFVKMLIKKDYQ